MLFLGLNVQVQEIGIPLRIMRVLARQAVGQDLDGVVGDVGVGRRADAENGVLVQELVQPRVHADGDEVAGGFLGGVERALDVGAQVEEADAFAPCRLSYCVPANYWLC